ncbi:MAG: M48 family metallopeptidase [Elusimicrobiaceae bacterium]|nr:M48 family metallopeptidase [Elusimicrobiaceae bacterium]
MLIYDHVARNRAKIFLITALFPIILSALIYLTLYLVHYFEGPYVDGLSVMERTNSLAVIVIPVVFAVAMVWMLFSYLNEGRMIVNMTGAKKITKDSHFAIYSIVEDVAMMAGLPVPEVYLIPEAGCNAFAAGVKPESAILAMTEGIVKKLTKPQLEGVIAHEMAHIKNRDVALMIMIVSGIGVLTLIGNILIRVRGRGKGKGAALFPILGLVFLLYGLFLAPIIRMMLSRRQEYQADATAALITRDPEALAQALEAISGRSEIRAFKGQSLASSMCFLPAVMHLFDTHPPIEKRIAALRGMLR